MKGAKVGELTSTDPLLHSLPWELERHAPLPPLAISPTLAGAGVPTERQWTRERRGGGREREARDGRGRGDIYLQFGPVNNFSPKSLASTRIIYFAS